MSVTCWQHRYSVVGREENDSEKLRMQAADNAHCV